MRFDRIRLRAPAGSLSALADFYVGRLGLTALKETGAMFGETELVFVPGSGEPFYHFAVLVPGNRFEPALEWIGDRVELLPDPETGDLIFDFDNWDALACYFHDPAGNIVELIAHRGIEESSEDGPFAATEVVGVSELGLVGDKAEMVAALQRELGLERWTGDIADEARLAFVGEKARTLILASPGRGWVPTDRPAEAHACEVDLVGTRAGETILGRGNYKIRRSSG